MSLTIKAGSPKPRYLNMPDCDEPGCPEQGIYYLIFDGRSVCSGHLPKREEVPNDE